MGAAAYLAVDRRFMGVSGDLNPGEHFVAVQAAAKYAAAKYVGRVCLSECRRLCLGHRSPRSAATVIPRALRGWALHFRLVVMVCARRAMLTAWRALRRRSTRGTATPTSRTRSSGTAAPIFSSCPPRRSRSTCCGTSPRWRGHLHRLASFSRLILTDLLGSGSSDAVPIHDRPAMQTWTDGLVAVLDAVGSKCASVFAWSESGLPVMLLTASHPHRVRSLVLCSPFARFLRASDQPFGMPESALVKYVDSFEHTVGTGAMVDLLAPSWAGDAAKRRWWARGERLAGGPGYFKALYDVFMRTDVRPALESIQAPTLLLHRRGDRHVRGEHAQELVKRIRHARLVELDGDDNMWLAGDADRVLDEVESFLTGQRSATPS